MNHHFHRLMYGDALSAAHAWRIIGAVILCACFPAEGAQFLALQLELFNHFRNP
jgi:hypothetical protein